MKNRFSKLLSSILCICMLVGLCQFSFVASAESTVTMTTTEFSSNVQLIPFEVVSDSTDWWAAIYPASQTAYGGSNPVYADYVAYSDYKDPTKTSFTYPSGDKTWRMKTWPLPDGEWKIVLFEHDNYTSPISEAVFTVDASIEEIPATAPTEYYVKKGGTGDGRSESAPTGSIPTVITNINADGWGEGDEVTVYVIDSGEASKEVIDSNCVLGYDPQGQGATPEHTATIRWTSYDPNVTSIIGHTEYLSWNANSAHWQVKGPSIFEDINIVDMRYSEHGGTDIYLNHYPVEFYNVKFGDLRGTNETAYTTGTVFYPSSTHFALGMIRGRTTVNRDQYVYLDNADIIGDYVNVTGYNDTAANQGTSGSVTLEIGSGTLKNLNISGSNAVETEVIGGDLSIILGEGVTVNKINTTSIPVVGGVFNLIQNYGATIPAGYTDTPWATSAKDTKAPYYNIVAGAEGLEISLTDEAGVFAVDTAALAYAVSADGKTVYYGEDELTLATGAWTVLPAASVDAIVDSLEVPTVTVDKEFKGWDTSVAGIITAIIEDATVVTEPVYFVKYGGTGDGRSYESPIGTIAGVIQAINADGYAAGDNVTVYLVPTGNEPTKEQLNLKGATEGIAAPVKEDTDLGFISFQAPNVAHAATITYTTYNYDATADNKMILANGNSVASSNHRAGSAHMYISGPSVFKDIYFIDLRMDGAAWDFYAQSYSLTFENVDFRRTARSGNDGYTGNSWNNHFYLGNHTTTDSTPSSVSTGYVSLDNADFIYDLYIVSRGEKTGDSVAYIGNDTTTGLVEELYTTNNATAIQHGVSSVIFNNTTINKFLSTKGTPTVDALQIILNNGSSIGSNEAVVTGDLYILTATDGVVLDITETAGTFAVDTAALAYAVSADGKTVYYGEDELTLATGTWTVLTAASVDAIIETLEAPSVTVDKEFKGWDTSVDGIITAIIEDAAVEVDPIYYVKNGGTGNGLSADAPIGNVYDAVAAINAAGYDADDEVTIFIMNGDKPEGAEKEFYFYDVNGNDIEGANAGNNADAIFGRFTFWAPGGYGVPDHTATIVLKPYDTEVETFIAQHPVIGQNSGFTLGGPTVFEGLTILTNRMYDRELFANGKDLTITDCLFKFQNCNHSNANSKFTGISNGHERVLLAGGANGGNFTGSTVRIESPMTTNNATYGLEIAGTYSASFSDKVNVYIDHEDFAGTVIWGRGAGTFNGGLNLVVNNGTVNNVDPGKGGSVAVTGGLQVIVNGDATMNELPANVTADQTWMITSPDATLDVTDVAGTFAIEEGKYIYTVSDDKYTINYYTGTITLDAGTYALTGADSIDAILEAVGTPEIPEDYLFKGWDDSVAGVITAQIVEKPTFTYYVQANATGTGLSADSPVATIKAAIDLINAAGATAEDDVTIYVLNGVAPEGATREFYFYDKDGNDIYGQSLQGGKYGRVTAFAPGKGATFAAHDYTINVKAYDNTKTTYLAYCEVLGANSGIVLNGDFIFDDITIVATRMYDRELFFPGHNVTFNNCHFAYNQGGEYEGTAFQSIITGNERLLLGASADNQTVDGGNVIVNSIMTVQNDTRYGISLPGPRITTFANEVNVTVNHEEFKGQILWGEAAATFNNGLNVVIENGNVKNASKNNKDVTINGGLQILVNDGGSMTDMLANVKADHAWIVTAVGADLALTETDGTFAVPAGKVAYVTDAEYAKEILYSVDGLLTLPEGTFTVKFADSLVDIKAAVTPFEDASMKFKGWIDDGAGKLTADYTLTGEAVVYYVQHGATGDGLSLETPGSFATVVEDINKKYGAGDEVTIKVVKAANEADTYTDLSTIALACIKDIPNHTAMLVIESADTENLSWLTTHQSYATSGYISTNVEITSPLTFKNIKIVDPRMDWYGDFYVNATNFTIGEGVTWYQPTYANNTLTLNGRARMSGVHGGSRSTKTFNTAFTVEFADGANLDQTSNGITISGYSTSGTMTFNEEVNFKFGNSTVPKIIVDNMNGGATLFKKNVNIVLNGTTVGNLLSDSGSSTGTTINGALQIVSNNANIKAYTINESLADKTYFLDVIGAAKLDVTEIAGKYLVPAGVVAIAVDAEGNRYVSANNILTVPTAGNYTVYTDYVYENGVYDFYNTVTLDIAELEVPTAEGKLFLGWVYADGTAPKAEATEFKAGDKLSAKFIDFVAENDEGTAGDYFIKGVQIRLDEPAGLRYIVEMDNEFYAALTQYSAELVENERPHFGTFVIPAEYYDSLDHADVPAYKLYAQNDEITQYTVCLINIKEADYDRDYTVYGYIDYIDANGVIHTLYTNEYSTSIYDVAKVAVAEGEDADFFTTIINKVEGSAE